MTMHSRTRRQHGVSILEMALALGIMGLLTVVAWRQMSNVSADYAQQSDMNLLERADNSLLAFVVANSRLPYAASPGTSTESSGLADGVVPWQTVKLPDATTGSVLYTLGASAMATNYIPIPVERMSSAKEVQTSQFAPGVAGSRKDFILDYCGGLGTAIKHDSATVAYRLRRSPSSPGAAGSDDSAALTRSVSHLWANLHCGDLIAAAARAHANAAMAAEVMHYAADEKLTLANINNEAAIASFVFSVLDEATQIARLPMKEQNALVGCTNLGSLLADVAAGTASGEDSASLSTVSQACANSFVDLALQMGYVARSGLGIAAAIANLTASNNVALADRQRHAQLAAELANRVDQNAAMSVYTGFYLK